MALNSTIFDVHNGQEDKSSILIFNLSAILQNYIHNLPLVFFIFGLFGFIGNLVTYLQPELRTNTCCIYTLCGSVVDIIHLLINAFPSFLSAKFNIHIESAASSHSCRMMYFLFVCLPNMSINFLVMSMIDRFACTCQLTSKLHRLNQLKVIPKTIGLTIAISCVASIYAPIMVYKGWTGYCFFTNPDLYTILNMIINGIVLPMVMLIFVLLTYRNIQQSRRRVVDSIDDEPTFLVRPVSLSCLECSIIGKSASIPKPIHCISDRSSSDHRLYLSPMDDRHVLPTNSRSHRTNSRTPDDRLFCDYAE